MKTSLERLVDAICNYFNLAQLDAVVNAAMGNSLEYYSTAKDKKTVVFQLFTQFNQDNTVLFRWLSHLKDRVDDLDIKTSVADYLNEIFGIKPKNEDPFVELVVYGNAFVDRSDLRDVLRYLFPRPQTRRVFLLTGPKECGKTYTRFLIRHIAKSYQQNVVVVDLLKNTIDRIISQLVNEMSLDVKDMHDRMAQDETKASGFITALRGYFNRPDNQNAFWFIAFDHHGNEQVDPSIREFAEMMINEVLEATNANIAVILLGPGNFSLIRSDDLNRMLSLELQHIRQDDIKAYITDTYQRKNLPLQQADLDAKVNATMQDLTYPLNRQDLVKMGARILTA